MRDLLSWNLSLFRVAGVQVRLHAFLLLFAFFSIYQGTTGSRGMLVYAIASLVVLLASVALHELGHCVMARKLGGNAEQVILWPLGGLTPAKVPHAPRAELLVALAGPLMNLCVCLVVLPPMWLLGTHTLGLANPLSPPPIVEGWTWQEGLKLIFWINWVLFLVNCLPAFPLDGGRIMRSLFWPTQGFRTAVLRVSRLAKLSAVCLCIVAWWVRDAYPFAWVPLVLLGILIYFSAKQEAERLQDHEIDEGLFGYDFSQGYTSLHFEHQATTTRRPGPLRQWLEHRREQRLARQLRQEQEEDQRVDEVLARLHQFGMDALSDDDRSLLERVSARYRSRQQMRR